MTNQNIQTSKFLSSSANPIGFINFKKNCCHFLKNFEIPDT